MSAQPPLVTVAIPCRTFTRFLPDAIESALAQTYPAVEICVADMSEGGEVGAVVARYGDRVRRLSARGLPLYPARQAALESALGEFFLNLDADDRLPPHYVERTVAVFLRERDPRLAIVYTPQRCFGDAVGEIPAPPFSLRRLKQGNFIPMCSLLRTSAARSVGFDPAFAESWGDYDLFLTLARRGFRAMPTEETWFERRIHPDSMTAGILRQRTGPALRRRLLIKHAGLYGPIEWLLAWLSAIWMSLRPPSQAFPFPPAG